MKTVVSRDNPLVKRIRALSHSARDRKKLNQSVLDGPHLVRAALEVGQPLLEIVVSDQGLEREEICSLIASFPEELITQVPSALFAQMSPVESPSGLLATLDLPTTTASPLDNTCSLMILDQIQDPGNLGTLLRTAAAAGLTQVVSIGGGAHPWAPKVLRAGMGAHFHLAIHERLDVVSMLHPFQGKVLATALSPTAKSVYALDLSGPIAWLFGAEGSGVSAELMALATDQVIIPMSGAVESLNVSAAAAICLFEQVRQIHAPRSSSPGPWFENRVC